MLIDERTRIQEVAIVIEWGLLVKVVWISFDLDNLTQCGW